jgi:hypothetical protein
MIGVNAARPSRYMPIASTTSEAIVASTITRSPLRPSSDRAAPNASASGCSVGAR